MPEDLIPGREAPDAQDQLRVRAAWLYFVDGMTQSEVAQRLGVNRVMVTRLIAEARKRGEVVIRIQSDFADLTELQFDLERTFGLRQAIVAPMGDPSADPTRMIAAAAGAYATSIMEKNMTVGVGWGRTLHTMLPFVTARSLSGVKVVSLLGGISQAKGFNPAEFAWQFATLYDAEGFLVPAPAIVDSIETKHALLEHCGLDQVFDLAQTCDVAFLSCGGIGDLTTSYRLGHISEAERKAMINEGAVGDVLYNFVDANGRLVDHDVNARAVSLSLKQIAQLRSKVLISGGPEKRAVLPAVIAAISPDVLITDEASAKSLLSKASASPHI